MLDVTITGLTFTDSFKVYTGATPVNTTYLATYPSGTTQIVLTGVSYNLKFYVVFEEVSTRYRVARLVNTESALCEVENCNFTFSVVQIPPPTPSISVTPSPSPSKSCTTYRIVNTTRFYHTLSYQDCVSGSVVELTMDPGAEITVCAWTGSVVAGECTVTAGEACIGVTPTPTPTVTPSKSAIVAFTPTPTKTVTLTPTNSQTPTPTVTPTASSMVNCGDYEIQYDDGTGMRGGYTRVTYTDCYGLDHTVTIYNMTSKMACIREYDGYPQVQYDGTVTEGQVTLIRMGNCNYTQ